MLSKPNSPKVAVANVATRKYLVGVFHPLQILNLDIVVFLWQVKNDPNYIPVAAFANTRVWHLITVCGKIVLFKTCILSR